MGFLANPVQSVSDTVSHVGQVVASSPIAQTVITLGAAAMGVPPIVTAGLLGLNTTAQTGSVANGLGAAALSAGTVLGAGALLPSAATTTAATGMGGGTGLTLGAGGETGLTLGAGGTAAAGMGGGTGLTASGVGAGGLLTGGTALATGLGSTAANMGGGTGLLAGAAAPGLTAAGTSGSLYDLTNGIGSLGTNLGSSVNGIANNVTGLGNTLGNSIYSLSGDLTSGIGSLGSSLGSSVGSLGSYLGDTFSNGLSGLGNILTSNGMLSTAASTAGAALNAQAAKDAAQTQADAQIRAAQIAADAAKFRPVGVTTNFGSSQFGYDANGNLSSAGYNLSPQLQAQQNQLMGASGGLLNQFTGSQAATAPMGQAAQTAMTLGNGYLNTDPQAQAAKYYADQQAILAPGRANDMAALQAQMQAQGRSGFAIGGGVGGQGAANPQLQALLNAQMQQNTQLSANATQGGMDYAKFGAGMVGTGGDLLSGMYGTQSNAYKPYSTALGGAQTIEGLGQNALTQGMALGSTTSAANAQVGGLLAGGVTNAANTMAPSNAYSPWGAMLSGAGQATAGYKFDPMTGKAL